MADPRHKLSREDDLAIAERYIAGETTYQIACDYPVTHAGITASLKRQNIPRNKQWRRRCTLNESAFDQWSADAAYWAGFLFADGAIVRGSGAPAIALHLAAVDARHIEKFRDFMGSTHSISLITSKHGYKPGSQVACFSFNSSHVADRLRKAGIVKGRGPIADEFLATSPDFYRGLIDGDGALMWNKKKARTEAQPVLSLVGTKESLEQFSAFVKSVVPENNASPRWQGKIWQISICSHHAKRVVAALYENASVALDRKAEIAKSIMEWKPCKELTVCANEGCGNPSRGGRLCNRCGTKQWQVNNREKCRAATRACVQRLKESDPEEYSRRLRATNLKRREASNQWRRKKYQADPAYREKIKAASSAYARRKVARKQANESATA